MPMNRVILLVSAALIMAAAPLCAQQYDFTAVDRLLQDSILRLGRGAALVLVQDGKVIYRKAFGRYGADSVVPIASATKWYSGALLMTLVDAGKLSLDDTVGKFFPSVRGAKAGITVRQLFSHTSGVATDAPCLNREDVSLADCAESVLGLPLEFAPGTAFAYGGGSMQVAGRIAEIAGGMLWDTLFRRNIAEPLGMTGTHYDGLGQTINPRIAGGAASSADDYAKFVTMILQRGVYQGRRVLSVESVAEMQKDQTFGVPIIYTPYENYESIDSALRETRYGIGEWRESVDPESGALLEVSSQGAFGFSPWVDLSRDYAGVLSIETLLRGAMPTYLKLKELLHAIIPLRATPASAGSSGSVALAALEQNTPNPFSGVTAIRFRLSNGGPVRLAVYDPLGREVAVLLDEHREAGDQFVAFDAASLGVAEGIYLYRLHTAEGSIARLMQVIR